VGRGRLTLRTERSLNYRKSMVLTDIAGAGVKDRNVLDAFLRVPRERFVSPGTSLRAAYGDHPLPIGRGQTISQPFIVALMMELLQAEEGDRVLEVGTGSGYQTALLAAMGLNVVTLEVIPELTMKAQRAVAETVPEGNVHYIVSDGYEGWQRGAPYSGIIVSAAPKTVPEPLREQLDPSEGRLVIPVGGLMQNLMVIIRQGNEFIEQTILPVRFVPLVREK